MRPLVRLLTVVSAVVALTLPAVPRAALAGAAPAAAAAHPPGPGVYVGKTITVPSRAGAGGAAARTFRVESHLGSGWWSHTFRGVDVATGERVAIKLHKPERLDRRDSFDKETDLLQRAEDPRIPKALGVGTTPEGQRAMVMELLDGKQLGVTWKPMDPRPVGTSVQIGMQVLRAVRRLEKAGIRHNDIHPGNVVTRGGDPRTVKLIDIGNATWAKDGARGNNPKYTAPEHGAGNDDVYSVGALLLHMITGSPDREGLTRIGDPALRAVITRMTHPDPAQRFPTAQSAIDALRPFQGLRVGARSADERRAALDAYYGEESAALAELGGLDGPAGGRSAEGHAGWAHLQSPQHLRAELVRKLDEQMRDGKPLADRDRLARYYAGVALRTNATGAVIGDKWVESPAWDRHYAWAKGASPAEVRDEIARRTALVAQGLGVR